MKATPNKKRKVTILCRGPTALPPPKNNKEVKLFESC